VIGQPAPADNNSFVIRHHSVRCLRRKRHDCSVDCTVPVLCTVPYFTKHKTLHTAHCDRWRLWILDPSWSRLCRDVA